MVREGRLAAPPPVRWPSAPTIRSSIPSSYIRFAWTTTFLTARRCSFASNTISALRPLAPAGSELSEVRRAAFPYTLHRFLCVGRMGRRQEYQADFRDPRRKGLQPE